jgi:formylglycine-generating enzyme required for sulfatase activity
MVFVQGGTFQLGNPDSSVGYSNERPVSNVTISGFYIGKYEVTQAQWQTIMGRTQQQQQALDPTLDTYNFGRGNNYPIYFVNWYETLVFCNKLSVMEGLTPAYRISNSTNPDDWGTVPTSSNATWDAAEIVEGSTGYRLPTEAQWEYAAKGGNTGETFTYAGSNTVGDVAWYSDNSGSASHEVGTKAPNGLGIYDMSGNVDEWCWDWYGNYTSDDKTDPMGASSGSERVWRGGNWNWSSMYVRSASRGSDHPDYRSINCGFRLARPAQ